MLEYIKYVKGPIILLLAFIFLQLLASYGIIPSLENLSGIIKSFFESYGLPAIAILSFVENIVGVNAYFPGSIVILTAMALSAGDPILGILTYATIFGFAFLAYNINYFLGKYLLFSGQNINISNKSSYELWVWYLGTFWHPHLAAITCVISGSQGLEYKLFFKRILIAGFFWNTFWGITMYNLGVFAKKSNDITLIMYLYLIGWLFVETYKYIKNVKS